MEHNLPGLDKSVSQGIVPKLFGRPLLVVIQRWDLTKEAQIFFPVYSKTKKTAKVSYQGHNRRQTVKFITQKK